MLITLFISFSVMISLTMLLMMNPLSLGMWILLLALLVALISGLISSSWYGFIIFLIYIGGMLVMFAYFASIQPNQHISLMIPMTMFMSFSIILTMTAPMLGVKSMMSSYVYSSSLYWVMNIPLLLISAFILFLAMVAVVKISQFSMGSLRSF